MKGGRISHPFTANVLGHLPAGDRPDHGADVGQRSERRELQRARGVSILKHNPSTKKKKRISETTAACGLVCYLGDGEVEVTNHGVLSRGGEAAGEAELDGAERDDERAEEGGDVGLAQDGHGGGAGGVEAGLARPHPHPVPAPAVGQQQRLLQRTVVVATALVLAAGGG